MRRAALAAARRRPRALSTGAAAAPPPATAPGRAYSWGQGFLGCLGHGDYTDRDEPALLSHLPLVKRVAAGWGHSAAITADDDLVVWGRTHDTRSLLRLLQMQQVPVLVKLINSFVKEAVPYLEPTVMPLPNGRAPADVACSMGLTLARDAAGGVFAFGANHYGQCGLGHDKAFVWEPARVAGVDGEAVHVAAGLQHSLSVTADGALFAWGKGERGQLGVGRSNMSAPVRVGRLPDDVVFADCGMMHSVALTAAGELFVWGKMQAREAHESGQFQLDQLLPRRVDAAGPVVRVACGQYHTALQTADGRLWQMGLENPLMHLEPLPVTAPGPGAGVVRLRAGWHSSQAVLEDGTVLEWDWDRVAEPKDFGAGPVQDVAEGWKHSVLLSR